jgi:hypothetical protein
VPGSSTRSLPRPSPAHFEQGQIFFPGLLSMQVDAWDPKVLEVLEVLEEASHCIEFLHHQRGKQQGFILKTVCFLCRCTNKICKLSCSCSRLTNVAKKKSFF